MSLATPALRISGAALQRCVNPAAIDPRTGRPGESDLASVTVAGRSVAEAEVQAKVLLLLGRREAMAKASRDGIAAVLVDQSGEPTIIRAGDAFDLA